jgi:hypothetical protein
MQKCPFFDICGAMVVRQLIAQRLNADAEKNYIIHFCENEFKECVHYKIRIEMKKQV